MLMCAPSDQIVWPSMLQCEGDDSGKYAETERERERQHMHWQRYKLQLDEKDICLYATICLLPTPNSETEWTDSSHLAITVLASGFGYCIFV